MYVRRKKGEKKKKIRSGRKKFNQIEEKGGFLELII